MKSATKIPRALSLGEEALAQQLKIAGIPYRREYRFDEKRKWRFDFITTDENPFAIEIEGGSPGKSRHTSFKGYAADCEKYNEAALLGWRVFRFTTAMVMSGAAIAMIERAVKL